MYEIKYLDLEEEFARTRISAEILIDIVDKHNLKVKIFESFGATPEKRAAAFGQLRFRSGPPLTNSVMWYLVRERKSIVAVTYPLLKKESEVLKNRHMSDFEYLFAPFV